MDLLSPAEITSKAADIWEKKASGKFPHQLIAWILAWIYIAMWVAFSVTSISGMQWLPFGSIKIVAGLTFSLWLILVMIAWAELFTGNALLVIALFQKKISLVSFVKNLVTIYIANFLGSLLVVGLLYIGQRHTLGDWIIWQTLINISIHKLEYGFIQAFSLGVLCNILVCLWVWLAYSGRSTADKVLGIIFPITAFVTCGFEHSVANMAYLPFAYLLKLVGRRSGIDYTHISLSAIFANNLLPVTLGNLVGGMLFVWIAYRSLYGKKNTPHLLS